MIPRFHIVTLGCKVNRVESDSFASTLASHGFDLTEDPSAADIVVINTCTVTAEADSKVRKAVRRAAREASGAHIVVTGCAASIDPAGLEALDARVVVESDKSRVVDRIVDLTGFAPTIDVPPASGAPSSRTRVPIKIQDGCDNACTYCIVHVARGDERSEPTSEVLASITAAHDAGVAEVVLTGINLGRYSTPEAPDLAALLTAIVATGVKRIRLSSIEPQDVSDGLIDAIAANAEVVSHLHLPLQSGSEAVLDAMSRRYTLEEFGEAVARLRSAVPDVTLTTDVIVGFPGESEEDFLATLRAVKEFGFSKVHVFRYSAREGTPAASMPDQIDPPVKAERAARLSALAEDLRSAAITRAAMPLSVLVERIDGDIASGTSLEYFRVTFSADGSVRVGDVVEVTEPISVR